MRDRERNGGPLEVFPAYAPFSDPRYTRPWDLTDVIVGLAFVVLGLTALVMLFSAFGPAIVMGVLW